MLIFVDESGFRLQPLHRRIWAPVCSRPRQVVSQTHDRLSVFGSLNLAPRRLPIRSHFVVQERYVRTRDVMRCLRQLHRVHQRPLVVVLTRLNVRRSAVRKLQELGAPWLDFDLFPAYPPDLNPVEALWSHTKYSAPANFVDDVEQQYDADGDVHFRPLLMRSFFHAAKLRL